jgi:O-antigen ligase
VTAFGQAQSTYLQFLGEGGILGAGALVLLLGAQARVLREGRRDPRNRIVVAALTGATAALMIEWTTDVTVRYAPVAASVAVIFGAAAALRPPGRIGLRIHSRASETVEPSLA